jgi:hypothetical protein
MRTHPRMMESLLVVLGPQYDAADDDDDAMTTRVPMAVYTTDDCCHADEDSEVHLSTMARQKTVKSIRPTLKQLSIEIA